MKFKLNDKSSKKSRAQSLIELSVVLIVLLILLTGVVEVGVLLNNYINIVDAARVAARESAVTDPFDDLGKFKLEAPVLAEKALAPLSLDSTKDDILFTIYSIEKGKTPKRLLFFSKFNNYSQSRLTISDIQSRLNPSAPNTGVVVVEIYYSHNQVLGMPFLGFLGPANLHAYSIMPMTAAEPTSTPKP